MLKEFKDFINKGNVVDLAVAVVIGAAFGAVINSFVNDVLMQIIGSIFGQPTFDNISIHWGDLLPELDTILFMPTGPLADGAGTRASPNLALTLFLAGVGLSAVSFRSRPVARFGAAQLGSAAASIALVDVLAFLSVTNGHGLVSIAPQMAIHSAMGVALLGTVLTVTAWRASGDSEERRQNRVPLMIALLVTGAAITLAQGLRANDRQRVRDAVQLAAQAFADRIGRDLQQRVAAMEGLARVWPGLRSDASEEAARAMLDVLPGAQALGWIDPRGSRRWLGRAGDGASADTGAWPEAALVDRARSASVARLEPSSSTGDPALGVITPVHGGGGITGYLWLTTGADPWLESALGGVYPLYDVTVQAGQLSLHRRVTPGSLGTQVWTQTAVVPVGSVLSDVRVWPRAEALATVRSAVPIVVLTAGTLLGVLLGLSASLLRAADLRTGQLTAAHRQLGAEMRERIAAQEALRQSEEQLQQAQRLEAVGRLSGGIARDFENILTTIRSNSRTLLHQGSFSGLARDALEQVDRAASRGSLLTARLLSFSQRQVLQPEAVRLGEIVAALREELEPLLGPTVHVTIERRPGEDVVFVDRQWMTQVVLDLVFDARESMPLGGSLAIRTMPVDDQIREAYGVASRPELGAMLEIEHSGRDLAEMAQGRLLEPFFSATQAGRGSGLALSSAHGIVKQSGGEIVTHAAAKGGVRLGIFLPVVSMPAQSAPALRLDGATIVVAESDQANLDLAARALSAAGCTVVPALGAEPAMACVTGSGGRPDMLVSAIMLPGISGVELASRLRAEIPALPVLFLSGYTSGATQQSGIAALDAALLQKPFTAEELVRRVAEGLGRSA